MPRREVLNAAEREALLAFPTDESELIRLYVNWDGHRRYAASV
jgi:hypothetical protein